MFVMTYSISDNIIKHFEERHADFQPLFSRTEVALTAPFAEFSVLRTPMEAKQIVLA